MALKNVVELIIKTVGADRAKRELSNTESSTKRLGLSAKELAGRFVGAAGVAAAVGIAADQLRRFATEADHVGKFADRLKVSTEFVSEMGYAAERSGVSISAMEMALQRGQRRLETFIQTGKGEAQPVFEQMGLSADILAGRYRSIEDLLPVLADRFADLAKEGRGTYEAQKLFDSEGVAMVQILGQGGEALDALRERARKLGVSLDKDATRGAADFNDAMTDIKASVEGLRNVVAPQVLADLTEFFKQAANFAAGDANVVQLVLSMIFGARGQFAGTPTTFPYSQPGIAAPLGSRLNLGAITTGPQSLARIREMFEAGRLSPHAALSMIFGGPRGPSIEARQEAALRGLDTLPGLGGLGAFSGPMVPSFGARQTPGIDRVSGAGSLQGLGDMNEMLQTQRDLWKQSVTDATELDLKLTSVVGTVNLIGSGLTAVTNTLIDGGNIAKIKFGDVFRDVAKQVIGDINRIIARALVMNALLSLVPGLGQGAGFLGAVGRSLGFGGGGGGFQLPGTFIGTPTSRTAFMSGELERIQREARIVGVS